MKIKLSQKYDILVDENKLDLNIPTDITGNLATFISLRPYQTNALARFQYHMGKNNPNPHLLFHMATGSGKTVLMAALILNLYSRGYRNFMFFVNSTQIIEKTKENFLNQSSTKFLFSPQITINRKPVEIRSVETFDAVNPEAINIHFTSIQRLHTRMHNPQENAVTLEDFQNRKIVMISDEAHHLNTETKNKLTNAEKIAKKSWEGTVTKIFSQNSENILLEFTATADMEHEEILNKYHDKILFDYSLKSYREDKYSKEIILRRVDDSKEVRMKHALILSQYRRKIAESHGIHCKPVILMKSKTIRSSTENEQTFNAMVEGLDGEKLKALRNASKEDEILSRAFSYLQERGMGLDEFALELKGDFSIEKVVNVNNLSDLENRQIELNSLEDASNELRVIFAVNKLDEGWDVLNLFDIVRVDDDTSPISANRNAKPSKTTMAEAQLIGRGARYFPFISKDDQYGSKEMRKYDNELDNPLRILEELYYHCSRDPRYITDIKNALRQTGLMDKTIRDVELKLKNRFKQSELYKSGHVWINKRVKNKRENVIGLGDYGIDKYFNYPHLVTGEVTQNKPLNDAIQIEQNIKIKTEPKRLELKDFERHILRFALDANNFFHYANLSTYFPNLTGILMFLESEDYLGGVEVTVRGRKKDLEKLTQSLKLAIVQYVLEKIESKVKKEENEYVGSKKFFPRKISQCFTDKFFKLKFDGEAGLSWSDSKLEDLDRIDLESEDWYAYEKCFGTDQEKLFVKFLHEQKTCLKNIYEEFYLLRNEKAVTIYAFENGQAFEPDYVLFLRRKGEAKAIVLQVFIEPKSEYLMGHDKWKEMFLKQIHTKETIIQAKNYTVYGLPFFNQNGERANAHFIKEFENLLYD